MPTNKKPIYYKKIIISAGCVMAFVVVVIVIAMLLRSGLTTAINKQLAELRAGDTEKAYSYTSTDFRGATSLTDFEAFINHYPALKDNKSATFTEKETKDDTGLVKGTLYSTDGSSTPIEYLLVKENGEWKIEGIQANPAGASENTEQAAAAAITSSNSNELTNTYDNKDSRYLMKYPASWEYEKAGDGTVIFSGKRGSSSYFSTVNIQTVLTKKTGGDFSTVKEFMADIKHQAMTQSPGVKFYESGPIVITEKNGTKDKGEYTIFSYQYKGKAFKQWQIVVLRSDGQVFYAWAYTSPLSQYPNDQVVAKNMLDSWVIY
jgi:hypothetical protein